jgi:hypothetical protein
MKRFVKEALTRHPKIRYNEDIRNTGIRTASVDGPWFQKGSNMAVNKETGIADIKAHVAECGGSYPQWYVGVAADARQRLFNDHAVSEKGDSWIYRQCTSSDVARAVEKHFLAQSMKGGSGGGDDTSDYVYAYKIARHTVE